MYVQYKNVGNKSPPHPPTGHVSPPTPWPAVASPCHEVQHATETETRTQTQTAPEK